MPELYPPEAILRSMAIPRRVEDLDIIGFADSLDESMLPSIVPPVFRVRSKPNLHLLPPYFLNSGFLYNSIEVDEQEIRELKNDEEITVFDQPFPAQVGFQLFIDQAFQPQYKLREVAGSSKQRASCHSLAIHIRSTSRTPPWII